MAAGIRVNSLARSVALSVCFVCGTVLADSDVASGEIVGYVSSTVRPSENVIGLPTKVGGGEYTLGDVAQLLSDGDKVQYDDGFRKQWAEIYEDADGVRHAFAEDLNSYLDDIELPSIGDRQILIVRRNSSESTTIPLVGAFDTDNPLHASDYTIEPAPLDKIKLDRKLVDSLTVQTVITNKVHVPFPTAVSKQFDIVLKDGRRLRVKVDPRTQLIVDAQTEMPVGISSSEIARFEEIGKEIGLPPSERASKDDLPKVAADVSAKSRNYNITEAIRETVIGTLWDADDKTGTLIRWIVVTLVIGFISKIGDLLWGGVLCGGWRYIKFLWNRKWLVLFWAKRAIGGLLRLR